MIQQALLVFASFFAIMNPLANTPIFLSLTAGASQAERKKIAWRAVLVAFIVCVAFFFLGKIILELFGITIPAFQIAGGIIIFSIGFDMLRNKGYSASVQTPTSLASDDPDRKDRLDVAISPLAVPILAGPGTIATIMSLSASATIMQNIIDLVIFTILLAITYFCFIFGEKLARFLGREGLSAMTKLMGLLLATIGVQMFLTGAETVIKSLGF
ncbi:MarC family protein [Culicoidibacter larvae]|uniref:UPF0056 membrane protein n=1 Tax=Culicoidibacter larvae TaxID=2579976 RepID=A0A5R8QBE3_9FIRM|nr:MarC family protein [Culicoidibacter larvae]TLG73845.1 MarC family protein [Culicoidibacter larvae]